MNWINTLNNQYKVNELLKKKTFTEEKRKHCHETLIILLIFKMVISEAEKQLGVQWEE